ncbi:hypothetical protein GLYMA_11G172700v4 [Glycine max]|uniref:Uncharacterized protein n=1 Tax=Glycine max TaxID=3847 RepID=A0A0R0HRE5_SOYBN|nr:hypothetical protein GYH30_031545 [Glycine max]KRH30281.1 hypothetical protein GLYMA_11G172700v4 [Glycine max]
MTQPRQARPGPRRSGGCHGEPRGRRRPPKTNPLSLSPSAYDPPLSARATSSSLTSPKPYPLAPSSPSATAQCPLTRPSSSPPASPPLTMTES